MFGGQSQEPQSQASLNSGEVQPQQASSSSFSAPQQSFSAFGSASAQPSSFSFSSSTQPPSSSLFGSATAATTSGFSTAPCGLFGQAPGPGHVPFGVPQPSSTTILTPVSAACQPATYPTTKKSYTKATCITTYEVAGMHSDLPLTINGRGFRVISKLLSERSRKVQEEVDKDVESVTIEVNLPLVTNPTAFVNWMHTLDEEALKSEVKTFNDVVDMLALSTHFGVNPELYFEGLVLSCSIQANLTVYNPLPPCWDRAFLPLPLALKVIERYRNRSSSNLFGGGFRTDNSTGAMMALEWLGERRCFNEKEIEALRNSTEFVQLKRVLQENYLMPTSINDYMVFAKRYPVAIDVFTIGDMFRSLGLI